MPRQEKSLYVCQQRLASQEEANQALDILENQILDHQTLKDFLYENSVMVMGGVHLASIVVEELKKQGKPSAAAEFDGRAFPSHCGGFFRCFKYI